MTYSTIGGWAPRRVPNYCQHRYIQRMPADESGWYATASGEAFYAVFEYSDGPHVCRAAGTFDHCERYVRCPACRGDDMIGGALS